MANTKRAALMALNIFGMLQSLWSGGNKNEPGRKYHLTGMLSLQSNCYIIKLLPLLLHHSY